MPKNPLASDPSRPWYLLRDASGHLTDITQDPARAGSVPPDDIVEPEWPAADWCGKRRPHPPHVWGGEGWSDFRCEGITATMSNRLLVETPPRPPERLERLRKDILRTSPPGSVVTLLPAEENEDDARRRIIELLLEARTWGSADLQRAFTVEQIAQRLAVLALKPSPP